MHSIKGYPDEWRIQEYLLITFFISWLSWGILILLTAFQIVNLNSVIGMILFAIGGFGPTFSALICLEGKLTPKKFAHFIFNHKKQTFWYFLLFAILEALVIGLSSMELNPAMPLWTIPLVFIICTLFGGGNEELGWRGTLQPQMQRVIRKKLPKKYHRPWLIFTITVLAIGLIWAIWHLPLWFVSGTTQQNINFGVFIIATIFQAFWLGCIYARTNSVFYCMLFHGLSNLLMSLFVIKINPILIIGFIIMAVLSVLLGAKPKSNSPSKGA